MGPALLGAASDRGCLGGCLSCLALALVAGLPSKAGCAAGAVTLPQLPTCSSPMKPVAVGRGASDMAAGCLQG